MTPLAIMPSTSTPRFKRPNGIPMIMSNRNAMSNRPATPIDPQHNHLSIDCPFRVPVSRTSKSHGIDRTRQGPPGRPCERPIVPLSAECATKTCPAAQNHVLCLQERIVKMAQPEKPDLTPAGPLRPTASRTRSFIMASRLLVASFALALLLAPSARGQEIYRPKLDA